MIISRQSRDFEPRKFMGNEFIEHAPNQLNHTIRFLELHNIEYEQIEIKE